MHLQFAVQFKLAFVFAARNPFLFLVVEWAFASCFAKSALGGSAEKELFYGILSPRWRRLALGKVVVAVLE